MQIEVPKFFKDYSGTLNAFQTGLEALRVSQDAADQAKYTEIMNSIVFIHDQYGGECIFAKGSYYNAASGPGGGGGVYKVQMNSVPTTAQELANITTLIQAQRATYSPEDGNVCIVEVASQAETAQVHDDDGLTTTRPITYLTYVYKTDTVTPANSGWHAVDVAADHVYFYDGINRTTAWGVKTAPQSMVTECTGMNLKQLLNYFLVTETRPTLSATWNITTPNPTVAFTNAAPAVTLTYANTSASTTTTADTAASANTIVANAFYDISYTAATWTSKVTIGSAPATITHGPATVTGLTYGGTGDESHSTYNNGTISGINTLTFTKSVTENSTATGTLKITYDGTDKKTGQAQKIDSTGASSSTTAGTFEPALGHKLFSSNVAKSANPEFIFAWKGDGESPVILQGIGSEATYKSNVLTDYPVADEGLEPTYPTNATYTSTSHANIVEQATVPFFEKTVTLSAAVSAKSTYIDAVLPIYTNGYVVSVNATGGTSTPTPGDAYSNKKAYSKTGTTATETTDAKLTAHTTLLDYYMGGNNSFNSNNTRWVVFGFGNTGTEAGGSLIYVPDGMKIKSAYTPAASGKLESTDSGYTAAFTTATPGTTTLTVNGKAKSYKVYQFKPAGEQGATFVLVEFNKA